MYGGSSGFGWYYTPWSIGYNDNKWYHLVGVFGPTAVRAIYINATVQSGSVAGTMPATLFSNPSHALNIGKTSRGSPNEYYHHGNISSVQIYNRALSATEVLQNYNITKGRYGL